MPGEMDFGATRDGLPDKGASEFARTACDQNLFTGQEEVQMFTRP